jgi:uncharacterized protein (DUF4415 family)
MSVRKLFQGGCGLPRHTYAHMHALESHMNKDFVQEWDALVATDTRAAAPKSNVVALKQIVTIRLDTDMLAWFRGAGPGYQTRINQILRQYMAEHRADGDGQQD